MGTKTLGRKARLASEIERDKFLDKVLDSIKVEYINARASHLPMNSPHEGYAVIKEELDELWDEIKRNCGRTTLAKAEARQVAAMCVAYMVELCQ